MSHLQSALHLAILCAELALAFAARIWLWTPPTVYVRYRIFACEP